MAVEKRNIFLENTDHSILFSGKKGRGGSKYPQRENHQLHAQYIRSKLLECYKESEAQKQVAAIQYKKGIYLEFLGAANYDLASKSLENISQGIRLLNIQTDDATNTIKALVFIPAGKEGYFLKKIEAYENELTEKGSPKNKPIISSIDDIRLAILESFWIGKKTDIPDKNDIWCEVWIRYDNPFIDDALADINTCCQQIGIEIDKDKIIFPERAVCLIKANKNQLTKLISCSQYIAELRKATEPTSFFTDLSGLEQKEWMDELLERAEFNDSNSYICLLDTGLNVGHPLITPVVEKEESVQAVHKEWGADDHEGHGTEMAGVAIYYDLKDKLVEKDKINISHKIESVKILPPKGENPAKLYGAITQQAVSYAEIANPNVDRTLCMAITADNTTNDDGSPTSWSAAVDNITSGAEEKGEKRLFFVSAGNLVPSELLNSKYPDSNILHSVEDPGQSWNAITVGAFSNDIQIDKEKYKDFEPVANTGQLSPYSSTSVSWDKKWPIKPEILLNGGNMATNKIDFTSCEDLSLLTTSHRFLNHPFSFIHGTSSATAQAAWMAAQIYNEYPGIWPETVRALLIHSARWPDSMRRQFCKEDTKTKGRYQLLHTCGYGIPNLDKAIQCMNNSVNLVIQSELQPYKKRSMNEMHIHELPWPKEVLHSLGSEKATLRVTLSYFIEPGPGEVGWRDKYRYASCGLRFDVINTNESLIDFEKRVNIKMRDDDKDKGDGSSRDWYLGVKTRNVGSIHSDFCEESAINLYDANHVAVYPVVGWWRERAHLEKYNEVIRYSLIVTIETPEVNTDLYTPIITEISSKIPVEITIPGQRLF